MNSWQPWNAGNFNGQFAATGYWKNDKADFEAHNVIYVPEIYPGMSTDNRDNLPPGKGRIPRNKGAFLWNQFAVATTLKAKSIFLGMYDELDEGTQIIKVTNSPPAQATFITYEGLPSDSYLCFTSLGTKMVKGLIPYNESIPDCPKLTQPSIPSPLYPPHGATVKIPFSFTWSSAIALSGIDISHYELMIDNVVVKTPGIGCSVTDVQLQGEGEHLWRIRARNALGNAGGWSVPQRFFVARN